jgi:hypothetical protein
VTPHANELAITTTPPSAMPVPVVTDGDMPGLAILGQWVDAAQSAATLVRPLVLSHFVPAAYKPQIPPRASADEQRDAVEVAVANATGAVLLGLSLGVDPLTALQNIYVVHGRPGMYAKFKVALALAAGHRVWDEEYSPDRATVCGQRKGSEDVVRITVTMDDAKRAGWTSNAAYSKTPADMLWARAAGRVVDRVAADTLHGIQSVEDIDPEPAPAGARATARVLPRSPAAEPGEDDEARPIDKGTWRDINAAFTALGVTGTGRTQRQLTALTALTGRPVEKGSDLTAAEGALVLDTLRGMDPAGIDDLTRGSGQEPEPAPEPGPGAALPVEDPPGDYDPTVDWPEPGERS